MPHKHESIRFLPNSESCFICGEQNPAGLKTRFYVQDGQVRMRLVAEPHHCGYHNTVHGGIIAAAVDECMGWAAARAIERMCYTAELTVRYVRPLTLDVEATVVTEVMKVSPRLVHAKGVVVDATGTEYVRAQGRFMPLSAKATLAVDDALLYRGDEERVFDRLRRECEQERFPDEAK